MSNCTTTDLKNQENEQNACYKMFVTFATHVGKSRRYSVNGDLMDRSEAIGGRKGWIIVLIKLVYSRWCYKVQ